MLLKLVKIWLKLNVVGGWVADSVAEWVVEDVVESVVLDFLAFDQLESLDKVWRTLAKSV